MAEGNETVERGGFEIDGEVRVYSMDLEALIEGTFKIAPTKIVRENHKRVKGKFVTTWYFEKTDELMQAIDQFYTPTSDRAAGAMDFRRQQMTNRTLKRSMEGGS